MSNGQLITYWDNYYSSSHMGRIPSQFAAFVLNEFSDKEFFVDCGCGNGRDSFFFANYKKSTLGLDASSVIVDANQSEALNLKFANLQFKQINFSLSDQVEEFVQLYQNKLQGAVFYARFFLHAIDEVSESLFFKFCASLMDVDSVLCLEFRTEKDAPLKKETAAHFRRFITINHIERVAALVGLVSIYSVEGHGFAKYRKDDAEVARIILKKIS